MLYNFYYGYLFMWLNLNNLKFEFQKITTSNKLLSHQMIWTQKVMNIRVVELIKLYNFYFGHLFMWLNLNNWNFEFQQMTTSNKFLSYLTIWTQKVMNIKVVVPIEIYNFYFGHSFIQQIVSNIVHKSINLLHSLWNYVRDLWICEQSLLKLCRMKEWPK